MDGFLTQTAHSMRNSAHSVCKISIKPLESSAQLNSSWVLWLPPAVQRRTVSEVRVTGDSELAVGVDAIVSVYPATTHNLQPVSHS